MHISVKSLLSVATLGAVLSACSFDEIEIPAEEIYTREFIKTFGVIDRNHDWSFVKRAMVTVNTEESTTVEVLAVVDGQTRLLAHYEDVQGQRDLVFDAPTDIDKFIVKAPSFYKGAAEGESVNIPARAAASTNPSYNDAMLSEPVIENGYFWANEFLAPITQILPENNPNNINNKSVVSDFSFVSDGQPFSFYPIHWTTTGHDVLGVYWFDGGEIKMHDLFANHTADDKYHNIYHRPQYLRIPKIDGYYKSTDGPSRIYPVSGKFWLKFNIPVVPSDRNKVYITSDAKGTKPVVKITDAPDNPNTGAYSASEDKMYYYYTYSDLDYGKTYYVCVKPESFKSWHEDSSLDGRYEHDGDADKSTGATWPYSFRINTPDVVPVLQTSGSDKTKISLADDGLTCTYTLTFNKPFSMDSSKGSIKFYKNGSSLSDGTAATDVQMLSGNKLQFVCKGTEYSTEYIVNIPDQLITAAPDGGETYPGAYADLKSFNSGSDYHFTTSADPAGTGGGTGGEGGGEGGGTVTVEAPTLDSVTITEAPDRKSATYVLTFSETPAKKSGAGLITFSYTDGNGDTQTQTVADSDCDISDKNHTATFTFTPDPLLFNTKYTPEIKDGYFVSKTDNTVKVDVSAFNTKAADQYSFTTGDAPVTSNVTADLLDDGPVNQGDNLLATTTELFTATALVKEKLTNVALVTGTYSGIFEDKTYTNTHACKSKLNDKGTHDDSKMIAIVIKPNQDIKLTALGSKVMVCYEIDGSTATEVTEDIEVSEKAYATATWTLKKDKTYNIGGSSKGASEIFALLYEAAPATTASGRPLVRHYKLSSPRTIGWTRYVTDNTPAKNNVSRSRATEDTNATEIYGTDLNNGKRVYSQTNEDELKAALKNNKFYQSESTDSYATNAEVSYGGYHEGSTGDDVVTHKITIQLAEGTNFGFYLRNESGAGNITFLGDNNTGENAENKDFINYSIKNLNQDQPMSFFNRVYSGSPKKGYYLDGWGTKVDGQIDPELRNSNAVAQLQDGTVDPNRRFSTAMTYTADIQGSDGNTRSYRYFSFEDWVDADFNDIVFLVAPETTETTSTEIVNGDVLTLPYFYAVEDLGSAGPDTDLDFNDVVFAVEKVDGTGTDGEPNYAYVTVLAAGGTLPLHLMYGDSEIGNGYGEVIAGPATKVNGGVISHINNWFGTDNTSTMFNVGTQGTNPGFQNNELTTVKIPIDASFSFSPFDENGKRITTGSNFNIKVERPDGNYDTVELPKENGLAPQMLVLPVTWKWPHERVSIADAYNGGLTYDGDHVKSFNEWVSHQEKGFKADKWYTFGVENQILNHNWSGSQAALEDMNKPKTTNP